MLDLKGKWVLITGASRGIGRLSALFMASITLELLSILYTPGLLIAPLISI